MALRTKTIEYAFTTNTSTVAINTRYDFPAITLYIPETVSRAFRSVELYISFRDANTGAISQSLNQILGIKLGEEAFDDLTQTQDITSGSDHRAFTYIRDVTSYFTANFGVETSQTCQAAIKEPACIITNVVAKLIITYEYEDTSAVVRIKTVKIPLESPTTTLTNSLTEIGTDQVPNLSTFLPESGKVFRSIHFEIFGNDNANATTNFNLEFALDEEVAISDGTHTENMISSPWYHFIWRRDNMDTAAVHAFKARATVTNRLRFFTVILVVTYEYNHTSSTTILNSIQIPWRVSDSRLAGSSTAPSVVDVKFNIQEPGTITTLQSGVYGTTICDTNAVAATFPAVKVGEQESFRSYTHTTYTGNAGPVPFMHRADTDDGFTLSRGLNTITLNLYTSLAISASFRTSGLLFINYTSGKHTNGDGVHNCTTSWGLWSGKTGDTLPVLNGYSLRDSGFAPYFRESTYFINAIALGFTCNNAAGVAPGFTPSIETELLAGESTGYTKVTSCQIINQSVYGSCEFWDDGITPFKRYPTDPVLGRISLLTAARKWLYQSFTLEDGYGRLLLTKHSIEKVHTGKLTGYTNDGANIPVDVFDNSTKQLVTTTTSITGGTYSFTVYDDAATYFTAARQADTRVGRSANATS